MRLRPAFAVLTLIATSAGTASAQRSEQLQGPLLIPPAPGESRSVQFGGGRGFGSQRGYVIEANPRSHRHVSPDDPRLASLDDWHRRLFGSGSSQAERSEWQQDLERGGGTYDLIAEMLASDDYFERTGGTFEDWFTSAAAETGRPVTAKEVWEWGIAYRRDPDRLKIARRLLDVSGLFGNRTRPVIRHEHGPTRGGPTHGSIELSGYDPYRLVPRDDDHHDGHPGGYGGHEHTAGYGPVAGPASPAELIADWYLTFNGRQIQRHELNKWLSDLNKGMPLEEIHASVLGGDEWYIRAGSSPPQWTASTIEALGQRPDRQAVEHWLGRLRRHGGDRYRTALEMVRTTEGAPAVVDWREDRDRRHDEDD